MTPERWERVKSLYDASRAHSQGQRAAFLVSATAGDDELRHDVQRLLDQPVGTADFVQFVGGPLDGDSSVGQNLAGRRFGGFEIKTLLGRGGMGEVYRAHDTRLGRDVAIKVLPAAFTADGGRLASFDYLISACQAWSAEWMTRRLGQGFQLHERGARRA